MAKRQWLRGVFSLSLLVCFFATTSCQGAIGDPVSKLGYDKGGDNSVSTAAEPIALRRLSPLEVAATLQDMSRRLGLDAADAERIPVVPLPAIDVNHGFSNTREPGNLTTSQTLNLLGWAEQVSLILTEDLEVRMGCRAGSSWDSCASDYAESIGALAFRRPIRDGESSRFEQVYLAAAADTNARDGVRAMWELALVSPDFLYLVPERSGSTDRLTAIAKANRLSYALWGTMPDAALLAAAESGALDEPAELRVQAQRLLDDPRAEAILVRFHREWLGLDAVVDVEKNAELFPAFGARSADDLGREFDEFFLRTIDGGGSLSDLLTSRNGYVNQALEELLGLDPVSSGDSDWVWRDLGDERAGAFTRPLYLASTAGSGEPSLVHRGVGILEFALCHQLSPPDDDVIQQTIDEQSEAPAEGTTLPENQDGTAFRKLAAVQTRASIGLCSGCHDAIDPIGLAFESFDAVGGVRSAYPDDGYSIAMGGTLNSPLVSQDAVAFEGAADLLRTLSQDPAVATCYASKWVEWATGRAPVAGEMQEVERLGAASQTSIRDFVLELALSPLNLGAP